MFKLCESINNGANCSGHNKPKGVKTHVKYTHTQSTPVTKCVYILNAACVCFVPQPDMDHIL